MFKKDMYIIAGLGNPGKEYEKTRHNMGFLVLDMLSDRNGISISKKKHNAMIGKGSMAGKKVMLAKPMTYMNESGRSLGEIFRYYGVDPEKMIVIYDDMDLEPGTIRIRKKGGPGAHNGMKSVVSHMGTDQFPRIRIGIGRTSVDGWKDFVLDKIPKKDEELLAQGVAKAADAVEEILRSGIDKAMNRFNTRGKKEEAGEDL